MQTQNCGNSLGSNPRQSTGAKSNAPHSNTVSSTQPAQGRKRKQRPKRGNQRSRLKKKNLVFNTVNPYQGCNFPIWQPWTPPLPQGTPFLNWNYQSGRPNSGKKWKKKQKKPQTTKAPTKTQNQSRPRPKIPKENTIKKTENTRIVPDSAVHNTESQVTSTTFIPPTKQEWMKVLIPNNEYNNCSLQSLVKGLKEMTTDPSTILVSPEINPGKKFLSVWLKENAEVKKLLQNPACIDGIPCFMPQTYGKMSGGDHYEIKFGKDWTLEQTLEFLNKKEVGITYMQRQYNKR